ncbi:MAG: chromosome segregation protein SMC [Halieaceae bacterium]|nr:chromosome segregation protein SMC [Halieaceae bacterium]
MRLKSIKLAGFKSFVDPTTVQFPHNMSAVVGPNGCGKSNIIDAVRWVMGESSAKNLRGESMTDVIFNGSGGRQPVGQASIELVFDNQDGTVGGEYARFSEIAIKRLVTRAGQSDYFLNGARCRRRDITDIFLGTGLGPRSYAIIEQGMISRLIESKPEELRVFIEEAAGISKYKERRRETEGRMRRTMENLERLQDIRDELGRQIYHLERQAQAAEKYREFKQQERESKASLAAMQWRELSQHVEKLAFSISDIEVQREAIIAEYRALEANVEEKRVAQAEAAEHCNRVQADYYAIGAEVTRFEQAINFQNQRHSQLQQRLAQTDASMGLANESLHSDLESVSEAKAALETIGPLRAEAEARLEQSTGELTMAEESMQAWQHAWDTFNQSASSARQRSEVQQSRIKHLEQVLSRLARRSEGLREELATLAPSSSGGDQQGMRLELEALREQQIGLEETRQQALQQREGARAELGALRQSLSEMQTLAREKRGRAASLNALQEATQAQGQVQVEDWINTLKNLQLTPLLEDLSVEQQWQVAVERVLADDIHGFVADAAVLTEQQIQSFPAAKLYLQGRNQLQKPFGTLAAQVKTLWVPSILTRVRVAETLDQALSLRASLASDESVITPEGVWMGADWVRLSQAVSGEDSVLFRQQEIDLLESEIAAIDESVAATENALNDLENKVLLQDRTAEDARVSMQALSGDESRINAQISAVAARFAKEHERKEQILAELEEAKIEYEQEEDSIAQARREVVEAIEIMEADAIQRETLISERDNIRVKLDELRQSAREDRDAHYSVTLQEQQLLAQVSSTAQAIERLRQQTQELAEQREQILEELAANDDSATQTLKAQLDEQLELRLQTEEKLSQARDDLGALEQTIRSAEQARLGIERRRDECSAQLEQQRLQRQTMTVRQQTLVDRLKEDEWTVDAALELIRDEHSIPQVQALLEELGRKISRLGAINLAAIDEFASQSERKTYLDAQHEDLTSALETLESAIRKIDKETRSRFRETFEEVNAGLQALFPRVFGGGSAHLEMTGEDLLDTGIAIIARPPGKKNSTIHLLSGGEKALTAIALVFSIFQLNPAPFCMLDEVDAPLDDANVGRYARMVKEMSEKVQFIYITHNKISMEVADQLLGVTMHEPGVSRLVSVDVEEAAELAAN